MNLQILIDEFRNRLEQMEEANNKLKNARQNTEKDNVRYERNEFHSWNFTLDICRILEVDCNKTMIIVRQIRKWEKRRKWQKCFNVEEHKDTITNYIKNADV